MTSRSDVVRAFLRGVRKEYGRIIYESPPALTQAMMMTSRFDPKPFEEERSDVFAEIAAGEWLGWGMLVVVSVFVEEDCEAEAEVEA